MFCVSVGSKTFELGYLGCFDSSVVDSEDVYLFVDVEAILINSNNRLPT